VDISPAKPLRSTLGFAEFAVADIVNLRVTPVIVAPVGTTLARSKTP
jgi:hypothetical protein